MSYMLTGLTEEQNKELQRLYTKAIDEAEYLINFGKKYYRYDYYILGSSERMKAQLYFELGDFEADPRHREL